MITPQLFIQITFISFVFHAIHSILPVRGSISHNSNDMPIIINSNNNVIFSSKHVLSYVSSNFPLHNGAVFSHFSRYSIRMCALSACVHIVYVMFSMYTTVNNTRVNQKIYQTHTVQPHRHSLSMYLYVFFFYSTLSTTCMGMRLGQRLALKCHESKAMQRMTCFK